MDAQDAGHIELSAPNPAPGSGKALTEAVGLSFRNCASGWLRAVGLARHPRLHYALRLRTP
jgi:hypothetical protein